MNAITSLWFSFTIMVVAYWATGIVDNKFVDMFSWYFQGAVLNSIFVVLIVVTLLFGFSTEASKKSSKWKKLITGKPVKIFFTLIMTILVAMVMFSNAKMKFQLKPYTKEFTEVVHKGPSSTENKITLDRTIVVNSYDDQLTAIVAKIDSVLDQYGYVRLGEITEKDQIFFCLEKFW